MVRAIVGANWGDEGKGKITDMLASESDIVVRFQGGANAGHTIINDYGRFALHLLPSGVCTPNVVNVLGPGVALDIEFFLKELASIEEQGLPAPKILISERAQVLMPYHVALDCYEEERLGKEFLWLDQVRHCAVLWRQVPEDWLAALPAVLSGGTA